MKMTECSRLWGLGGPLQVIYLYVKLDRMVQRESETLDQTIRIMQTTKLGLRLYVWGCMVV